SSDLDRRPEEAGPGQRPDDHQGAVEEHVGEQVHAEVPLLPQTDVCLLAEPRLAGGRPQVGHGCHLLPVTVPPPAADHMSQRDPVRQAEGPFGCRWSRSWRAARPWAQEQRPVTLDREAQSQVEPEDDMSPPTALLVGYNGANNTG